MNIVISYRREDAAAYAGRLHSDLRKRFGEDCVFLDIAIRPGEDWEVAIEREISSCDVFIAVIGKQWLTLERPEGGRRLDDPDDVLRMEVGEALKRRDVTVIPVLVEGAKMPTREQLPAELSTLSRRQAIEISDTRWDYDVGELNEAIEAIRPADPATDARGDELIVDSERGELTVAPPPTTGASERESALRRESRRRLWLLVGAGVVAALVAGAIALFASGRSSSNGWSVADTSSAGMDAPPSKSLNDVIDVPGSEMAVAVGRSGRRPVVWTYNGTTWSPEELRGSGVVSAVAASGGTVIVAGSVDSGEENGVDGMIWTRRSDDGGEWRRTCPSSVCGGPGKEEVLGVEATSFGYVAVGRVTGSSDGKFDAAVWLSNDGTTWRAAKADDLRGDLNQVLKGVVEVRDKLVGVGRNGLAGAAWISDDAGVDWTLVSDPSFQPHDARDVELEEVDTIGTRIVAVGRETSATDADQAAAWFSDKGLTWTRAMVEEARFGRQQMLDLTAGSDGLTAVGNDASEAGAWQSPDGETWTAVTSSAFSGESEINGVAQLSDGTLVAVGTATSSGRVWLSASEERR